MILTVWKTVLKTEDVEIPRYVTRMTDHHNQMPQGLYEAMHLLDARHRLRVEIPRFSQHKQIINQSTFPMPAPIPSTHTEVTIYYLHDKAIVEATDNKWSIDREGHIVYEPPLYFRLGCKHPNLVSTTPYNCLHVYDCSDCGAHWTVDSSD